MRWLLLLALLSFERDNFCAARERRCVQRCTDDYTVGSMEHLNCKTRCREDYLVCRKEEVQE